MLMIVLAGVDGTGTADAAAYRTEFARSHVRVLTQRLAARTGLAT